MKIDKNSLTYANEHPKGKKPIGENIKVAKSELSEYLRDEYEIYKKDMFDKGKKPLSFRRIKKILLEQVLPTNPEKLFE